MSKLSAQKGMLSTNSIYNEVNAVCQYCGTAQTSLCGKNTWMHWLAGRRSWARMAFQSLIGEWCQLHCGDAANNA